MIFNVCVHQYFISHTTCQRLPIMRHRLTCKKVNLHSTVVTRAQDPCGLFKIDGQDAIWFEPIASDLALTKIYRRMPSLVY